MEVERTPLEHLLRRAAIGVFSPTPGTEASAIAGIEQAEAEAVGVVNFYVRVHPWLPKYAARLTRLRDAQTPWVTREGVAIPLDEMHVQHAANILRFWKRRGRRYRQRLAMAEAVELAAAIVGPLGPGGDMAADAAEREEAEAFELAAGDCTEWFEELPLVVRLREIAHIAPAGSSRG